MTNIVDVNFLLGYTKAIQIATIAHAGQVRKNTNLPYITHPIAVAKSYIEWSQKSNEAVNLQWVQALILHDVIEDTEYTYDDITVEFGEEVANLVLGLTNDKNLSGMDKAVKTEHNNNRLFKQSKDVLFLKLFDVYENCKDAYIETMLDDTGSLLSWGADYLARKLSFIEDSRLTFHNKEWDTQLKSIRAHVSYWKMQLDKVKNNEMMGLTFIKKSV